MSKILYWAIELDDESKKSLLGYFPPKHKNIYAEHVILVFNPTEEQDKQWSFLAGKKVSLTTESHYCDELSQVVSITGIFRNDKKTPHIIISCADGVKPAYSNELVLKSNCIDGANLHIKLDGIVMKRANNG